MLISGPAAAANKPALLTPEQMDGVTAGKLTMDLELSANALGPTVTSSTQGSVMEGRTSVLRVAIDETAPPAARARLLGVSDADVGIAVGKAEASGANDAHCSANVAILGADYTSVTRSQQLTPLTATCACGAFAVGLVH